MYYSLISSMKKFSVDPDAQAFITAAAITDNTQKSAVNSLVLSLKSYGIWSKMKALYPFIGGTAASHKFNLKDPRDLNAAFRLTFVGGWTHTNTGALPNGTNAYANTYYNSQANFNVNNANLSYYSRTSAMKGNAGTCLLGNTSNTSGLILRNDYFNFSQAIMTNGSGSYRSDYTPSTNGTGLWSANRTSSVASTLRLWRNGVAVGTTPTLTDCIFLNLNLYLSAINFNNIDSNYSNHQCAFASIGDGLTDVEASNFYTAVQAYQTSLSRQV